MAERRADQESFLSPTMTWVAAAVAGLIVALVLAVIFGAGWLTSFILGLIVFFGAGWVLGRIAAPEQTPNMLKSPGEVVRSGAAGAPVSDGPPPAERVAPASVPEPAVAPTSATAAPAAPLVGPVVTPAPAAVAPATPAVEPDTAPAGRDAAISERVREAARAAGEAAKLMQDPVEPAKPAGLDAARGGAPDDLKRIKGVGPKLEELLHSLGYFHFDQIAAWSAAEVAWIDSHLEGFHGRATRDEWVPQARLLAAGEETEFSQRVDKGEVY
jgi:NADH-quinone oxidoreductase subunit E